MESPEHAADGVAPPRLVASHKDTGGGRRRPRTRDELGHGRRTDPPQPAGQRRRALPSPLRAIRCKHSSPWSSPRAAQNRPGLRRIKDGRFPAGRCELGSDGGATGARPSCTECGSRRARAAAGPGRTADGRRGHRKGPGTVSAGDARSAQCSQRGCAQGRAAHLFPQLRG